MAQALARDDVNLAMNRSLPSAELRLRECKLAMEGQHVKHHAARPSTARSRSSSRRLAGAACAPDAGAEAHFERDSQQSGDGDTLQPGMRLRFREREDE